MDQKSLLDFFAATPRLAELCTQNGWPDPNSLKVSVIENKPDEALCAVSFDEVVMEGSGCEAGRVPCWGKIRLRFTPEGNVAVTEIESGKSQNV
jgi:hypothetical protein